MNINLPVAVFQVLNVTMGIPWNFLSRKKNFDSTYLLLLLLLLLLFLLFPLGA
jgi:hypothetical protein